MVTSTKQLKDELFARGSNKGVTFDDFLVSLREVAKTCKFCSYACREKSIHDQIIEGCSDGDTTKDLLQESDLILLPYAEAGKQHTNTVMTL